jgi:hypothetical protein
MSDEMTPEAAADPSAAPPATFEFLVHTLFTQALMALGRIPNPICRPGSMPSMRMLRLMASPHCPCAPRWR